MAARIGLTSPGRWAGAIALVVLCLTGCVATPAAPAAAATPLETLTFAMSTPADLGADPTPSSIIPISASCRPTDQDQYVYNPDRLVVVTACVRVSGTVEAIRLEADGDLHILIALDPAFAGLLRPSNEGEELGDLVIEPVCLRPVTQDDAIATCLGDRDPLAGPTPGVGEHVWMEGRYVLDSEHGGWAELHPLYRWGSINGPTSSAAPGSSDSTPAPAPTTSSGSTGFYTPPAWDGHSDVDCADFDSHAQAQSFFIGTGGSRAYDPYRLDGDNDGLACESLP